MSSVGINCCIHLVQYNWIITFMIGCAKYRNSFRKGSSRLCRGVKDELRRKEDLVAREWALPRARGGE